jgi:hypothetical protein
VAERALVPLEGREHDTAFGRLVSVLDQEARHEPSFPRDEWRDIGTRP